MCIVHCTCAHWARGAEAQSALQAAAYVHRNDNDVGARAGVEAHVPRNERLLQVARVVCPHARRHGLPGTGRPPAAHRSARECSGPASARCARRCPPRPSGAWTTETERGRSPRFAQARAAPRARRGSAARTCSAAQAAAGALPAAPPAQGALFVHSSTGARARRGGHAHLRRRRLGLVNGRRVGLGLGRLRASSARRACMAAMRRPRRQPARAPGPRLHRVEAAVAPPHLPTRSALTHARHGAALPSSSAAPSAADGGACAACARRDHVECCALRAVGQQRTSRARRMAAAGRCRCQRASSSKPFPKRIAVAATALTQREARAVISVAGTRTADTAMAAAAEARAAELKLSLDEGERRVCRRRCPRSRSLQLRARRGVRARAGRARPAAALARRVPHPAARRGRRQDGLHLCVRCVCACVV